MRVDLGNCYQTGKGVNAYHMIKMWKEINMHPLNTKEELLSP